VCEQAECYDRQIVLIVDRLMPNEGAALISRVES
jgi:hypothetical protein